MSEPNQNQETVWENVGVAYLSRSGKSITLSLNGINYTISVKGVQNLISGDYSTTNISKPQKRG